MLTQRYNKLLTRSKFQKSSIFAISDSQHLVTLGRLVSSTSSEQQQRDNYQYQYDSFCSTGESEINQIKNLNVMDVNKQDEDEYQQLMVFKWKQTFGLNAIQTFQQPYLQTQIDFPFEEAKIMNARKLLVVGESRQKIEALDLTQTKSHKPTVSHLLYKLYQNQYSGMIRNLHLLSNQQVLFHSGFGQEDQLLNYDMKCLDIVSQQIEWKVSFSRQTYMTDKIVNVGPAAFVNGAYDMQHTSFLNVYDRRVSEPVLVALHSEDDIWGNLNRLWTGRGSIQPNFDQICNHSSHLQVMGMFSFLSSSFSFPFLLDLRRPANLITLNYPHGNPLMHLKCFEVFADQLVAIERDYKTYSFKQARLCSYEISS